MCLPPLADGHADMACMGQGEAQRDAKAGVGIECGDEGMKHGFVAVRGFYEELGLSGVVYEFFECFDALDSVLVLYREVAGKCEVLSVHAADDECEDEGGGAYEWLDGEFEFVCCADNGGAGVCDCGKPGFGHESDVVALCGGLQQGFGVKACVALFVHMMGQLGDVHLLQGDC